MVVRHNQGKPLCFFQKFKPTTFYAWKLYFNQVQIRKACVLGEVKKMYQMEMTDKNLSAGQNSDAGGNYN